MNFRRLRWLSLGSEADRALARQKCRGRAGVYILRRRGARKVRYVGSSWPGMKGGKKNEPNRLWKTINRHFQSCRGPGVYSFGQDNFCVASTERDRYEVAILLVSPPSASREIEQEAIEHFAPTFNTEAASAAAASPAFYEDAAPPAYADDGIPF